MGHTSQWRNTCTIIFAQRGTQFNPQQAFINYLPATAALAAGQTHSYRYTLMVGESLHVTVDSLAGDADVVV